MDVATEIRLLGDLQTLATNKQCFVAESTGRNAVWKYTSQSHFDDEIQKVLRPHPQIVAHSSELAGANAFLRRDVLGMPVLLTRDEQGEAHAFLNVCRHRGTRLVDADSGCKARLTCPYHAWSWNTRGELLNIPFGEEGFPDADPAQLGLKALACEERYGWIFICAQNGALDIDSYLGELAPDLAWLAAQDLEVKGIETTDRPANWKLLVEGGLEAYHFRIVHRKTIGPHFPNNLSSYERFGDHLRSVLPRATINDMDLGEIDLSDKDLSDMDLNDADRSLIREQANVLYTFFPISQFLVMQDHIAWIQLDPLAPDLTRVRVVTLGDNDDDNPEHWHRNHAITAATLREDGEVAESIQSVIHSGANEHFQFGRFESALTVFNQSLDRFLDG